MRYDAEHQDHFEYLIHRYIYEKRFLEKIILMAKIDQVMWSLKKDPIFEKKLGHLRAAISHRKKPAVTP